MAAAVALGGEIGLVVRALADPQGHALDDLDFGRLQRRHLPRIVGEEPIALRGTFANIRAATA